MAEILFLAHRIPFPPDKGDKIRSWNLLKHLLARHRVHLGCFVDDPADMAYVPELNERVASLKAIAINPFWAKVKSLSGFLSGDALSVAFYKNRALRRWVAEKMADRQIDHIFLFSSPMAEFALPYAGRVPVIMDFVDMDSDKWTQYAKSKSGPMAALYRREARKLAAYERKVAGVAAHSLFVTVDETALFCSRNPDLRDKITTVQNGVDTVYFDPALPFDRPVNFGDVNFVFTGAMDYWANVDAVDWFVGDVWPQVRESVPGAQFFIVGSKPTAKVRALAKIDAVHVTGRVADVRPYLANATAVVAPMRIARGVQNKVLEGMSMARPVVTTPQGFEGIEAIPGRDLYVENMASDFADRLASLCGAEVPQAMEGARAAIVEGYSWAAQLAALDDLMPD